MSKMDKEKIFADLESHRKKIGLTYIDIERIFAKNGIDYHGMDALSSSKWPQLIYWTGWNQEAIDLFQEYIFKYNLVASPTSALFYLMDGKMPKMPILDIYRKKYTVSQIKNIKHDFWVPCEIKSR